MLWNRIVRGKCVDLKVQINTVDQLLFYLLYLHIFFICKKYVHVNMCGNIWVKVQCSSTVSCVVLWLQGCTRRGAGEATEEWEDEAKSKKASHVEVWWARSAGVCVLEEDHSLPEETAGKPYSSSSSVLFQCSAPSVYSVFSSLWLEAFNETLVTNGMGSEREKESYDVDAFNVNSTFLKPKYYIRSWKCNSKLLCL